MSEKPKQTLEGCGEVWSHHDTREYSVFRHKPPQLVHGSEIIARIAELEDELAKTKLLLEVFDEDPLHAKLKRADAALESVEVHVHDGNDYHVITDFVKFQAWQAGR